MTKNDSKSKEKEANEELETYFNTGRVVIPDDETVCRYLTL